MSDKASPNRAAAAAWIELRAQIDARSTMGRGSPHLTDYALDRFEPKTVMELLLDPEPTFFAHKDLLFSALSTWTICPSQHSLVQEAMVLTGIDQLAELEKNHRAAIPQDPLLADIISRLAGPGIDFYREFYYPIGGLSRVLKAQSLNNYRESMAHAARDIGFTLGIMKICHYHSENLSSRDHFRPASVKAASVALATILDPHKGGTIHNHVELDELHSVKPINSENCRKKHAPYSRSASLIYAAKSVWAGDKSLLDPIIGGSASYATHGVLVDEGFGRAAFIGPKIIGPMFERESLVEQMKFLPPVPALEFAAPKFEKCAGQIRSAFAKARKVN